MATHLTENDANLEEILKKKIMKLSITEGSVEVFNNVLTENFIIPFSISINFSPFQVGLLGGLIITYVNFVGINEYYLVFLISGIVQMIAIVLLTPKAKK